jgi:hypothetical protein
MDSSAQQNLLRKYEQFQALPADKQQRLRDLEAQIAGDPHGDRLREVLKRYHEWLKTITSSQRAELAELSPERRVEKIEQIQRQQRVTQRLESLTPGDSREIWRWIHDLVKKHHDDVIASMSTNDRRRFESQDESSQRRWLIYRTLGGWRNTETRVTQDDIDRLAKELSESARAALAAETTPETQRRLVGMWIFGTLQRSPSSQGDRRVNPLLSEDLLEFLQNEVAPAEREQLLKKPREEMLRELRKMYFERGRRPGEFGPFDGPGRRRGGRKGPGDDERPKPRDGTPRDDTPRAAPS